MEGVEPKAGTGGIVTRSSGDLFLIGLDVDSRSTPFTRLGEAAGASVMGTSKEWLPLVADVGLSFSTSLPDDGDKSGDFLSGVLSTSMASEDSPLTARYLLWPASSTRRRYRLLSSRCDKDTILRLGVGVGFDSLYQAVSSGSV